MSTNLSQAQSAQQGNRTTDGKYTFGTHAEPGDISLDQMSRGALVTENGAPAAFGYRLSEAGFKGTLSPETAPDDNLHSQKYPQYKYTSGRGRSFTVSQGGDEAIHIADRDCRDDDGYVIHYGEPGTSIDKTMRDAMRARLVWDHGSDSFELPEDIEFRSGDILQKDGVINTEIDLSDDDGEFFTIECHGGELSAFNHQSEGDATEGEEQDLFDRLGGRDKVEAGFAKMLHSIGDDEDLDPELAQQMRL